VAPSPPPGWAPPGGGGGGAKGVMHSIHYMYKSDGEFVETHLTYSPNTLNDTNLSYYKTNTFFRSLIIVRKGLK